MTTIVVALVDASGYLILFVLLSGQRHDLVAVRPLIKDIHFDAPLGDKAFDAGWLRKQPDDRGALAVIPPRRHRKRRIDHAAHMHRWRHPIENHFAGIREFRAIAARYDKTYQLSGRFQSRRKHHRGKINVAGPWQIQRNRRHGRHGLPMRAPMRPMRPLP